MNTNSLACFSWVLLISTTKEKYMRLLFILLLQILETFLVIAFFVKESYMQESLEGPYLINTIKVSLQYETQENRTYR